jgi:peptide/nickel transport system substrate-binding protein
VNKSEEVDDVSRRRNIKVLSLLAAASLVTAACAGDDDDDGVAGGTGATAEPTTGGTGGTGDTGGPASTAPEGTTGETGGGTTQPEGTTPAGAEDVGTVGGSGCGIPHGPYEDPGEPSGEVRVAWNQAFYSYNQESGRGNAVANNNPMVLMGLNQGSPFTYYDQDLNLINNDQFGTCTVESLDPLSVTYQVNDGVTWSDGVQIDAADMILNWAALNGQFSDAKSVVAPDGTTAATDRAGNPVVQNPQGQVVPYDEVPFDEEGNIPQGWSYKESRGIQFDGADPSMALITQFPEVSEDGLGVTMNWDTYYVDYQTSPPAFIPPAHVVGRLALGVDDPAEAKQAVIEAFQNNDQDAIKKISEVWNTAFDFTALPDDPGLYLSAGPYLLTEYEESSQMVFEANPDYTWGPRPHVATIVYRIIGDPTAAVQAMENEEIDIIQPQSTADLLQQVEGLSGRGVEVDTGNTATYEHVDLVFDNGGPFDPATYGDDAATALAVRQAFLKSIPRQQIVDRLIVPLNPDAELRGSFTQVPGSPDYDAMVANNGSADYDEPDVAGAQALLEDAGVQTPIDVRLLFDSTNTRRVNEYELLRDAVQEAGFNLIDQSSPDWGSQLSDNSLYDASLFGWQSTAVAVADTEPNFATSGWESNNFGHYSNREVDNLYKQLQTETDPAAQQDILQQVEQHLYQDGFGVPIYQHPGLTAWNSNYVTGVSDIPLSPTVFWNFWEWEAA